MRESATTSSLRNRNGAFVQTRMSLTQRPYPALPLHAQSGHLTVDDADRASERTGLSSDPPFAAEDAREQDDDHDQVHTEQDEQRDEHDNELFPHA